jgi:hypothetical protein
VSGVIEMRRISFSLHLVQVAGSRGAFYTVEIIGDLPFTCTCPDYEYRATHESYRCKHMRARSGKKAIGTTRCGRCFCWLSPSDLKDRSAKVSDPAMCAGCLGSTS